MWANLRIETSIFGLAHQLPKMLVPNIHWHINRFSPNHRLVYRKNPNYQTIETDLPPTLEN